MIKLSVHISIYVHWVWATLCVEPDATCVLHDGSKTHVAQHPNGYGPKGIEEINI